MLRGERKLCHFHGNQLYFASGWEIKLKEIGLVSGRDWDRLEPGECVTESKRTNTYRVVLKGGEVVYFKRYLYFGRPLKFYMIPSETAVEAFGYTELAKLDIPAAEPVAVGEIRRFGSLFACCIVTREIPQTITLIDYAVNEWRNLSSARRRIAYDFIESAICHDLGKMHANSFFHFDPKWRNILIRKGGGGEIVGLWWIDGPRSKYLKGRRHDYGMIYDLANLGRNSLSFLSRSQRLRFLYRYCGQNTPRKEIRKIVEKIEVRFQRKPSRKY